MGRFPRRCSVQMGMGVEGAGLCHFSPRHTDYTAADRGRCAGADVDRGGDHHLRRDENRAWRRWLRQPLFLRERQFEHLRKLNAGHSRDRADPDHPVVHAAWHDLPARPAGTDLRRRADIRLPADPGRDRGAHRAGVYRRAGPADAARCKEPDDLPAGSGCCRRNGAALPSGELLRAHGDAGVGRIGPVGLDPDAGMVVDARLCRRESAGRRLRCLSRQ